MRNAFFEARKRPGGANLSLQRIGVSILWQGKGGLGINGISRVIRTLMQVEEPPHYIIIHIAGNDIGFMRLGYLHWRLVRFLHWISVEMPHTIVVWSQILPRAVWRACPNNKSMDNCRKRLNSSIASKVIKAGGCYIRYPDIAANSQLVCRDGVHLTSLANQIFLNSVQGALETFILGEIRGATFPDSM